MWFQYKSRIACSQNSEVSVENFQEDKLRYKFYDTKLQHFMQAVFKSFDKNKDDKLSYDEFKKFMMNHSK